MYESKGQAQKVLVFIFFLLSSHVKYSMRAALIRNDCKFYIFCFYYCISYDDRLELYSRPILCINKVCLFKKPCHYSSTKYINIFS